MTTDLDVIFLGINDAGMRIYEWLCDYEDVSVQALLTSKEQLEIIGEVKPDYIVSCGFQHIVPERILNIPEEGSLNLHPAYLPYNRGANPNVWSIVEGTPAGVTLHHMDSDIDTGPIIARRKVDTYVSDTGKDLHERLEDAQVDLFQETWPKVVENDVTVTEQDSESGTYHRSDEFESLCNLNPDEETTVKDLLDQLRALTFPPYQNAKIEIDGETYHIEVDIDRIE